ncbi:MAG: tryptophan--tRNA ligase, partial [Bacteroidia bacterium]|nr:tryptophan--tRNA ligase [Bacteroidia bacterium]
YQTETFPEPYAFNFGNNLVKVPGLDGSGKMGKSEGEGNAVFLADSPEVIRKKVMRAVSDSGPTQPNQPKPEPITNLFTLMGLVSEPATLAHFNDAYNSCTIRYGDMKKQLAEDIIRFTAPLYDRIQTIVTDDVLLKKVMDAGKEKAKESASKTIREVREVIGFLR